MRKQAVARIGGQPMIPFKTKSGRRKESPGAIDLGREESPSALGRSLPQAMDGTKPPPISTSAQPDASGAMSEERKRLQSELIEVRERYRGGALEAASTLEKYGNLSGKLKSLLDEEFPGWDLAEPADIRSNMVTLYFQYRADADRAAAIQEKFERITHDIEVVLNEEFPDWQNLDSIAEL